MTAMTRMLCSAPPSTVLRPAGAPIRPAGPRSIVIARVDDGEGVSGLLARDKKLAGSIDVVPELSDDPGPATAVTTEASAVVKTRKQRQAEMAAKAEEKRADPERPKNCKGAIDRGLELFGEKKYQDAIDMFNLALELPGNGAYRMPDSPREYSCPSEAEENAALYNMACAYAQMGSKESALACLEAVLDNGFTDYDTVRNDPDLSPCRGAELELLIIRFQNPVAKGVTGLFKLGQTKQLESDSNKNKPWIMW